MASKGMRKAENRPVAGGGEVGCRCYRYAKNAVRVPVTGRKKTEIKPSILLRGRLRQSWEVDSGKTNQGTRSVRSP